MMYQISKMSKWCFCKKMLSFSGSFIYFWRRQYKKTYQKLAIVTTQTPIQYGQSD